MLNVCLPGLVDLITGTCLRYKCSRSLTSLFWFILLVLTERLVVLLAVGFTDGLTNESARVDNSVCLISN